MNYQLTEKDWEFMQRGEPQPLGTVHTGFRVPAAHLHWFVDFQDFLVCQASQIENDPYYAAWFLKTAVVEQQTVILDHASELKIKESGWEFDLPVLAELVGASLIVAPWTLNDSKTTFTKAVKLATEHNKIGVMGVVVGETLEKQIESFRRYASTENIYMMGFPRCLPNRIGLLRRLADLHLLESKQTYCLLGFNTFGEMSIINDLGQWTWLLNTQLPIAAALAELEVTVDLSFKDVMLREFIDSATLSSRQLYAATANIIKFKALMPDSFDQLEDDFDEDEEE